MTEQVFYDGGKTYVRINKQAARKLFNAGASVMVCPCKLRPFGIWHPEAFIQKDTEFMEPIAGIKSADPFERVVNATTYYNCSYEAGKYLSFYAEKNSR